ncbi:family of serine hydrolases 1 [Diutina catenulata]
MKVLFLPGFLQNGKRLASRSRKLEAMLAKHGLTIDYVDPPMKLKKKEDVGYKLGPTEKEAEKKWQSVIQRDFNRCWWDFQGHGQYVGFEDSFRWVCDYIEKNGPYVGIMGFSQGSAMAAILTNTITKYTSHPAFKFTVCISGFPFSEPINKDPKTRTNIYSIDSIDEFMRHVRILPAYREYFTQPPGFSTKVVVVYGRSDPIVPENRTLYLARTFPHATVVPWDGGHDVPGEPGAIAKIESVVETAFTKL